MLTPDKIVDVITFFIPFLFCLCFHEYAHGWVAKKFGDNTAEMMGRLTMNPLAHIDWLGTVILPIMAILFPPMVFFGWAKPVPVNEGRLNNPRKDMFWVALAGPMSNILLYVCGLIALAFVLNQSYFIPNIQLKKMFGMFLQLNLFLAFFNLLPVHPLDGGKIIGRFLPMRWNYWLESKQQYSLVILMLLVIFGGFQILALPVNWVFEQSIGLVENI